MAWGDTREVTLTMPRMSPCFFTGRSRVVRVSRRTSAGSAGTGGHASVFLGAPNSRFWGWSDFRHPGYSLRMASRTFRTSTTPTQWR